MITGHEHDPDDAPGEESISGRPAVSYRGRIARGMASAMALGVAVDVPWTLLRPVLRPENIADALASLFLGLNMLFGYIGGRTSARAGLAHDDARAQWTMAWAVSVLLCAVPWGVRHAQNLWHAWRGWGGAGAAASHAIHPSATGFAVLFTVTVLLVRFGYAMGTYSQAKRDGRVRDEDEDEASVD